mmetsp:Transcript_9439/g.23914  ORF Transcript_9439/g.23914 Transcript_9439/m.23914 type:complete len:349 (+) Transcript_9439:586-1632(+)
MPHASRRAYWTRPRCCAPATRASACPTSPPARRWSTSRRPSRRWRTTAGGCCRRTASTPRRASGATSHASAVSRGGSGCRTPPGARNWRAALPRAPSRRARRHYRATCWRARWRTGCACWSIALTGRWRAARLSLRAGTMRRRCGGLCCRRTPLRCWLRRGRATGAAATPCPFPGRRPPVPPSRRSHPSSPSCTMPPPPPLRLRVAVRRPLLMKACRSGRYNRGQPATEPPMATACLRSPPTMRRRRAQRSRGMRWRRRRMRCRRQQRLGWRRQRRPRRRRRGQRAGSTRCEVLQRQRARRTASPPPSRAPSSRPRPHRMLSWALWRAGPSRPPRWSSSSPRPSWNGT